jgi:hypothetical protein
LTVPEEDAAGEGFIVPLVPRSLGRGVANTVGEGVSSVSLNGRFVGSVSAVGTAGDGGGDDDDDGDGDDGSNVGDVWNGGGTVEKGGDVGNGPMTGARVGGRVRFNPTKLSSRSHKNATIPPGINTSIQAAHKRPQLQHDEDADRVPVPDFPKSSLSSSSGSS